MNRTLTLEQREAIAARGQILVSASAGSGKTFVMIERLVEMICAGADIKRVLAMTFTNSAAGQMRERLRRALQERLKSAEGELRLRLKAQLAALPMAEISTIHSFCLRIVRSHFYLVGVDSAFRIMTADSTEAKLLSARALDEVFETCYSEKEEGFFKLLSVYMRKKRDENLRRLVLDLYNKVRIMIGYRELLSQAGEDLFEKCCDVIEEDYIQRISFWKARVAYLRDRFDKKDEIQENLCEMLGVLASLSGLKELFAMKATAAGWDKFKNMPQAVNYKGREEDFQEVKKCVDAVKDIVKELKALSDEETERSRYENAREISAELAKLLLKYDDVLTRLKTENAVLDYNDLEQYAYRILQDPDVSESVRSRFDYAFVDEYQDVNAAQESIVNLVGGKDLFLVGDAKQAIYSFRGSRSQYFLKRRDNIQHSLSLTENFRSAPAILEAVNKVFSYAMTEKTSGIDYAREPMRGGSKYGGHDGSVSFYLVPKEPKKTPPERGVYDIWKEREKSFDAQAEMVCDIIQKEHGSEWYDADEKLVKKVEYGDIALLVRSNTADVDRIIAALSRRNIPVASKAKVNVCDFWEARLLIDFLSYLDDPEQDIPMASALLTRIGGMTEAELCKVREAFPFEKNFRTALRRYSLLEDTIALKLKAFFLRSEQYRAQAEVNSCAEIANFLLSDGLEAEISAKKDGELRMRRVNRLISEMQGSVGDFLRQLKAAEYKIEYAENGGENAVKVRTIHDSKGLEFPVVILPNLNTPFHSNERSELLFTEEFLFAPKSYDREKKVCSDNLLRRATILKMDEEERRGELNLLYVAMTRAKFRLHMLFRSAEQGDAVHANRFSDFVDFESCEKYFTESEVRPAEEEERPRIVYRADESIVESLREVFHREYPHAASTILPMKSTATQILEEEREKSEYRGTGKGSTPQEGVAYHAFLQNADFSKTADEEFSRMRENKILSEEQLALLNVENLRKIFALPAIQRMKGRQVLREQKFLAMIPAGELYGGECEDEILVQGAIDAMYPDEDGWMILDYKYSSHGEEELKENYAPQIALYKKAAEKALKVMGIRARLINIRRCEEIEM